jgi:hypothetical protein
MIDYLTHYYMPGTPPFRSLSALPETEAIGIMESLYDEKLLAMTRFKDPHHYLRNRKQREQWVRESFILKGGKPRDAYPHYMILGESKWIVRASGGADPPKIRIPLSVFAEDDVSFTYPDSMISYWFGNEKPPEYYLPAYHGLVFTRAEILSIVARKGMPEDDWHTNLPADLAPYIEAQVWNHERLQDYMRTRAQTTG